MSKLEISNAMSYLDTLSGKFRSMSVAHIVVNNEDVVMCNPKAFEEIADQLALVSKIVRTEMIGESEDKE